jgi:predicted DNA-binding transcriptional regulator AlpA
MSDQWLDTKAAAEYTGFAASTLEKMRTYGGGAVFSKRGRLVRYRRSDLDVWLSEHVFTSTSELRVA